MPLSAPDIALLVAELLSALALVVMWLGDRQRQYMLWWAIAHSMLLPVALLIPYIGSTPQPSSLAVLLLNVTMSTQSVCLIAGVISYRSARLRPAQVGAAILVATLLFFVLSLLFGATTMRAAVALTIVVALLASAAMLWSLGRFERVAASFLALRGVMALTAPLWMNLPPSPQVPSLTVLLAIGTMLALLIAAYQRSLDRLHQQYRILELAQELTAQLRGVNDEHDLARRVLAVMTQRLHWEQGTFMSLTTPPMTFIQTATLGVEPTLATPGQPITIASGGMIGQALSSQRIQFSANLTHDRRVTETYRNHPTLADPLCQVVIPVSHGGGVLGVVVLRDRRHRELSESEQLTLESLGQVIGLSLANTRNLRELAHRADHDALTGLGNRSALHQHIREAMLQHPDQRGAVLLFDLDHFKQVNDALGHAVGDQLLQALAKRLQHYLADRPARLFRLGGDEFVILHQLDECYAPLPLARELADVIAEPMQIGELSLRTPASIGVAIGSDHGRDSHELLRCADVAMYHAKQNGAGVTLYERSIDAHKLEHLTLLSAVNDGLEKDQFELFYQPFINLSTGEIEGCEGLIRWRHPSLGLIGAAEFMPLIEATDLIRAITRRVIDIAMNDAARWLQAGIDARVAINLSARNLLDPELPAYLLDAAALHQVAPDRIQLEITETILIKDPASAEAVMQRLTDAGFTLALDDFGTGYSSLAYLARFPIHTLKIDRSFVRDMLDHAQSRTIVESTIVLARGLGLRVTAEGVEQQAEADLLRKLGCDCAQGYLFSRPVPAAELSRQWMGRDGTTTHVPSPF